MGCFSGGQGLVVVCHASVLHVNSILLPRLHSTDRQSIEKGSIGKEVSVSMLSEIEDISVLYVQGD